jgi:23S rRNA-/tRNA-specific pseudouridylate synthase
MRCSSRSAPTAKCSCCLRSPEAERTPPTLDIPFEDDALIFVNKPAGVVVQQRMDHPDEPYLHDQVTRHTSPAYLMQRLDRDTSGVMFFSKRGDLNARLTRQFVGKRIGKRYLAICEGALAERQTIDTPIARAGAITFAVREGGKTAITHVRPLHATAGRCSRSCWKRAGPIRSACTSQPLAIRWPAIGSMANGTPRGQCCMPPSWR